MAEQLALPRLVAGLKNGDWQERFEAAFALAQMGNLAKGAVPALVEALADDDPLLRKIASVALGSIGPDALSAISALTEVLLHDDESSIRRLAAMSLSQIECAGGPSGAGASFRRR